MILVSAIAQLVVGWIYGHLLEYCVHRSINHFLKDRGSSTFKRHQRACIMNLMHDFSMGLHKNTHVLTELKFVSIIVFLHVPLIFFFPYFFVMVFAGAISYIIHHKACHSDVITAREYYSWHYDHHMGVDRHANFGVRLPIFDLVFCTRVIYKGTKKEKLEYGRKLLKYKRLREIFSAYREFKSRHREYVKHENKD